MPATVIINRWTGAGPTKTNITGTTSRQSTSDVSSPGTANPIPIPTSGTKYSYWCTTRLSASTSPSGTINNLRWYTDGASGLGTGVAVKGQSATSYVQASGVVGDSGTVLSQANHAGLTAAPVDVFTFTSGSPKTLTGSITNPTTGDFGDEVVFQVEVISTASPGTTPSETFTWKYDET